jgi:hypothetical protein
MFLSKTPTLWPPVPPPAGSHPHHHHHFSGGGGGGGGGEGTKTLFAPFYTKKRSFCQDRLGTKVGKVEERDVSAEGGNSSYYKPKARPDDTLFCGAVF